MAKLKTGRHTTAIKTARQALKHRWANVKRMDEVKELTKQLLASISSKNVSQAKQLLPKVVSIWARVGRSHVVHHRAASRKIARLSKAVHKLSSSK